jgi:hypothetical protein
MGARQLFLFAALTVLCCSDGALALPLAPQGSWTSELAQNGIMSVRWRYRYRRDYASSRDASARGDMTIGLGGAFRLRPGEGARSVAPRRRGGWVDPPASP